MNKSSKIYFIAPSMSAYAEKYKIRVNSAIKNFKNLGHDVIVGPNVFLPNKGLLSNDKELCAKEFMDAYINGDIIISVGGGEMMIEILEYIDFSILKKYPNKIFLGYSDNTNLTFTLTTILNFKTIYGPNASGFDLFPFSNSILDTYEMLFKNKKIFKGYPSFELTPIETDELIVPLNLTEPKIITALNYIKPFKGVMIGGCLDSLISLCGTKFDNVSNYISGYKDDGIIWFLETCDLNPLQTKRALIQLKYAGWFKYVKGFIIGRPLRFNEIIFELNHNEAIKSVIEPLNVPILFNVDLGHLKPALPILCGASALISYTNDNIIIEYE